MNILKIALSLATAGLLTACASNPQHAALNKAPSPAQELKVIIFPGGFNWPLWAGQEQGLFAKHGVNVKTIDTPNSTFQITGLAKGDFDIAMTAIDNLIAYREGQGAPGVDGSDLTAVMGADNGFLRLASVADVRSIAELKGKQLSVDSLTTGYAFVLLEIMERNGLMLNRDYTTVPAGGVLQRYNDLIAKKHAATMLIAPFDVMAKASGVNVLGDASSQLGNYQGLVAGVRKSWAKDNGPALTSYIKGYRESLNWLYEPKNKEAAIQLFMKKVPTATRQSAEVSYSILLDPKNGFERNAELSLPGTATVVQLREKYGRPAKKMQPVGAYYDPSFFNAAK
jgi:ABC-type nitrate/sulfonate/bicarbonate transport system substrate-binding protein